MKTEVDNVKQDIYQVGTLMVEVDQTILKAWNWDEIVRMPSNVLGIMTIAVGQKISRGELITVEWLKAFQYELDKMLNPLDQ